MAADRPFALISASRAIPSFYARARSGLARGLGVPLALLIGLLAGGPGAAARTIGPRYYVALGDSLSVGVQPNPNGVELNTDQGYTDQLAALERTRVPSLRLVKFGCPGDSTTRLITGRGDPLGARRSHCDRSGGSQLKAAERFLRSHHRRGEIALITIDIGANDIDQCTSPGVNVRDCLSKGKATIRHNVPRILSRLNAAAPRGTPAAGMTLYDPSLSNYLRPSGKGVAIASTVILHTINDELLAADRGAGFRTADLSSVFQTYDYTDAVSFDGQALPIDVARVCSWSWACTPPPSGPDIHLNQNGYAVVARVFAKVFGRLPS